MDIDTRLDDYRVRGPECLCGNLRMAARAASRVYDQFLAPSGLTAAQLSMLWAVVRLEPAYMNQLAAAASADATTLTRNLLTLQRDGLISTQRGRDRRTRVVSTTRKGRELFVSAMPYWEMAQSFLERELGITKRSWLRSATRTVANICQSVDHQELGNAP